MESGDKNHQMAKRIKHVRILKRATRTKGDGVLWANNSYLLNATTPINTNALCAERRKNDPFWHDGNILPRVQIAAAAHTDWWQLARQSTAEADTSPSKWWRKIALVALMSSSTCSRNWWKKQHEFSGIFGWFVHVSLAELASPLFGAVSHGAFVVCFCPQIIVVQVAFAYELLQFSATWPPPEEYAIFLLVLRLYLW